MVYKLTTPALTLRPKHCIVVFSAYYASWHSRCILVQLYTLYFRDLTTGKLLKGETVPNVLSVVFAESPGEPSRQHRVLFYTQADRCATTLIILLGAPRAQLTPGP